MKHLRFIGGRAVVSRWFTTTYRARIATPSKRMSTTARISPMYVIALFVIVRFVIVFLMLLSMACASGFASIARGIFFVIVRWLRTGWRWELQCRQTRMDTTTGVGVRALLLTVLAHFLPHSRLTMVRTKVSSLSYRMFYSVSKVRRHNRQHLRLRGSRRQCHRGLG